MRRTPSQNRIMGMLPDAMGRTHIIPVGERFTIGELSLTAFHTSHDTDESVGYRIDADGGELLPSPRTLGASRMKCSPSSLG